MAGTRSPQKRVAHIEALLGEIGTQTQVASHLVKSVFRAFYDFLTVACLTAGVVMAINGRHRDAVIWGSLGVLLALGWASMKVAVKGVSRMMAVLRKEWNEAPATLAPKKRANALPPSGPKASSRPRPVRPRSVHGH